MKLLKIISLILPIMLFSNATNAQETAVSDEKPIIKLYKSATCGCCGGWADRAREAGFKVEAIDTENMETIKKLAAVPEHLVSCHTAIVAGYVVEGHVPLSAVEKLLETRPQIKGISVPGMPMGSPGMEFGDEKEAFDVITFGGERPEEIFQSFPAK